MMCRDTQVWSKGAGCKPVGSLTPRRFKSDSLLQGVTVAKTKKMKISKQSRFKEEIEMQLFPDQLVECLRQNGEGIGMSPKGFRVKTKEGTFEFGEEGTYVVVAFERVREDIQDPHRNLG
jgi:hypothetical protein